MSCGCLACALMAAIHRHAEARHDADPSSASPTINAAEALSALSQIQASLVFLAPDAAMRHALTEFRDEAFAAALRSAETGEPQDVSFVAPGARH